jgi:hypothetical protein
MSEAAQPRRVIAYPTCGDWSCDDDYDWEAVGDGDSPEFYGAVKREEQIVRYHEPRDGWRRRLQEERDKRNGGDPLWFGKV